MPHRLPGLRRLGRRGTALVILGALWIGYGWTLIGQQRITIPGADVYLWHQLIPQELRGYGWGLSGIVGMVFAGRRQGHDRYGFTALVIPPLVHVGSYLSAGVTFLVTAGEAGYRLGLASALVWTSVVALIMLIAGWDEPGSTIPSLDGEGRP